MWSPRAWADTRKGSRQLRSCRASMAGAPREELEACGIKISFNLL